ncbi:MAG: outer membrane beta-barrel protein [Alphaproteobacteria bacterium]
MSVIKVAGYGTGPADGPARLGSIAAAVSIVLGIASPAVAQGAAAAPGASVPTGAALEADDRKVTVMTRPKPELDPSGVRMGSFLLYPSVGVGVEFDDNIYRTRRDREADFIARVMPRLRAVSDWNNHSVELDAGLHAGRYLDNTSEDFTDWTVGLSGRLDISRATQAFAAARHERLHEDRGSPDAADGVSPTRYGRTSVNVGASHRINRLTLSAEGRYVGLDFDDVRRGGGRIDNDDRDRHVWIAAAQASYEIVPAYQAFVRAVYNVRDYRRSRDDFGIDRDSEGVELVVGTEFDLTGLTFGSVFAGWRGQWYADDRLGRLDGFAFGGQLTWNVTPITTAQLTIQREIEETSVAAAEGFWSTGLRATLDHELLRNLILRSGLSYWRQEYEGIDRDDDVFLASGGAIWQANRHLGVGATYTHERRESRGRAAGIDYRDNRLVLTVTGRL